MPASFIALQCFECSTMQVKQQKKSSNKWTCVVCNQKQSVRKVFAQASMAKDVRKFVQNFNMSRQLSDQKLYLSDELEISDDSPKDEQKRKRHDWTEYVDDREEYCGKFDKDVDLAGGNDELEAMVVTEIPKALFKKPKVKGYSSDRNGDAKLLKPQFPSRSKAKNVHSQEGIEVEGTSRAMISKRNDYTIRAKDSSHKDTMSSCSSECTSMYNGTNDVGEERTVRLQRTKGPVSKWSSFITDEEEDDEDELASRGTRDSQSNHPFESLMNDQRVEDDIHPDFL